MIVLRHYCLSLALAANLFTASLVTGQDLDSVLTKITGAVGDVAALTTCKSYLIALSGCPEMCRIVQLANQ